MVWVGLVDQFFVTVKSLYRSDWDINVCLTKECQRKGIRKPDYFNNWCDLRLIYSTFYNRRPQGLAGALQDLGMAFDGREHSGIIDAKNTASLAFKLISHGCVIAVTKCAQGISLDPFLMYQTSQKMVRLFIINGNGHDLILKMFILQMQELEQNCSISKSKDQKKTPLRENKISPMSDILSRSLKRTPPLCLCGRRARCLTASTSMNYGRRFYACSLSSNSKKASKCRFFLWEDSLGASPVLKGKNIAQLKAKQKSVEKPLITTEAEVEDQRNFQTESDDYSKSSPTTAIAASFITSQYFGNVNI